MGERSNKSGEEDIKVENRGRRESHATTHQPKPKFKENVFFSCTTPLLMLYFLLKKC